MGQWASGCGERRVTLAEVQAELRGMADQLLAMEDRAQALHDAIPPSDQEEAMLEGEVEWDLATELRATLDCFIGDRLRPAVRTLERVAQVENGR